MTRPLRLEYSGALYYVTSRGGRREDIYLDDDDREEWLQVLSHVCSRYNWLVHTYCQMGNHYHLLVETVDGNLSKGMRQLNGLYTQRFNRRHGLSGHLYQGRYKAILIQKENYLLELTRYVVLSPLRVDMVKKLEDWPWSSYLASINVAGASGWLDVDWLLGQFGKRRKSAIQAYIKFVMEGKGLPSPLDQTRHQLLLGDDNFVRQYKQNKKPEALQEISKAHRRVLALSLDEYKKNYPNRKKAMAQAYLSGAYSMAEIGKYFGVHYMTVSRAVRQFEGE